MRPRGITLMELVAVIVIIAILAMIGVPNYYRAIERGYRREAVDLLETIYNGERAYCFTKSQTANAQPNAPATYSYYPLGGTLGQNDGNPAWGNIFMDNPHIRSIPQVAFQVSATGSGTCDSGATFQAIATRMNDPCSTQRALSITQAGGDPTGNWPENGTCP